MCQKRTLIEKSLGEVPLPTKMPRVNASLPKQAAKKEEIQRSEHYYNNVTVVAMELTMSWAVICGCFTWSEILLFTLAFIWPSFCIPSVIVGISISVCTEVSVLCFGFELVDIVNHYWIKKKIKIAVVINLVCGRVHCYWDAVIIPKEQRYFDFLSEQNDGLTISLKKGRPFVGPLILATG